jgi:hypothetical protein
MYFILLLFILTNINSYSFYKQINVGYSPYNCTVVNYDFTFLYDTSEQKFKVHGLWGELCLECENCGFPSCCNIDSINYNYPNDTTNFIKDNWFNSITIEECTNTRNVILFEHEYYKHISCTDLKTTDEFLQLIIFLYNNYYEKYVNNNCIGYNQLWINLNSLFEYNGTLCL